MITYAATTMTKKGLVDSIYVHQTSFRLHPSARRGQTVRGEGGASVPSASTRWTIRKWHPNLQWRTAKNRPSVPYPRTVRDEGTSPALLTDFLPNALQLKTTDSTDRTKGKLELATNVTNCQL
jgi:hypothetical protein